MTAILAAAAAVLAEGRDLSLATVRPDGYPQATVVSYVSDGLEIYFGCGAGSQKAANLATDDRVSLTVTLPYADWGEIRGLSLAGRCRRVIDNAERDRVGALFADKFPPAAGLVEEDDPALFAVTPEVICLLDYRQGLDTSTCSRLERRRPQPDAACGAPPNRGREDRRAR